MLNFLYKIYNRDKMLDENLVNLPPKREYRKTAGSFLFIGSKIKNLYDEERICIQDAHSPERLQLANVNFLLFGIKKELTGKFKMLANMIIQQKAFDLIGYNILLNDFQLSCNECYFNLKPPIYPIDNTHIKKVIPDFDYNNFICFNPDIPNFQSFASLNLFLIIQD